MLKEIQQLVRDQSKLNNNTYNVVLIITNIDPIDLKDTLDTIVESSTLALSIVMVSVGSDNFEGMGILRSEDYVLKSSKGMVAMRDVLKYVDLKDCQNSAEGDNLDHFKYVLNSNLIESALKDVPKQVVDYFKMYDKAPGNKK